MLEDNIIMPNVEIIEDAEDTEVIETIQVIEVDNAELFSVDTDNAFAALGEPNEGLRHSLLNSRDLEDQHPITAITGLKGKLDRIEALKTVYSNKYGFANYYLWEDGNIDQEDRFGYFVSLSEKCNTIKKYDDITQEPFGVIVDEAAFIGGQNAATFDYTKDDIQKSVGCGLVSHSGMVCARCESDIVVGDYVVPNQYGVAEKSPSNYGYLVCGLHEINGIHCVHISLEWSPNQVATLAGSVDGLNERVDQVETNIISAMNVANEAYNKASEVEASAQDAIGRVDEAVGKVEDAVARVEDAQQQTQNATVIAAQAKAIAESAATSAESIRNEAVEKANEALAETSELRKEFEDQADKIDADLDNAALELREIKENINATRDELQSNIDDVSAELDNTKTDLSNAQNELQSNIDSISTELNDTKVDLNNTRDELESDIESTNQTLNNTKDELNKSIDDAKADIESVEQELIPLSTWPDAENPTGIAGFVARADEDSATLANIVTWQGDTNKSIAEFKQEVSDTYATIESVTALDTKTTESITAVKQEAAETYATIESVSSLKTEMSESITGVKQEASETYATIESVTSLKNETSEAIADVKQETSDTYATIESLNSFKSETSDAITLVKQEAEEKYATIESVTSLETETSSAIAKVKQEASETYATIESVNSLETDMSDAIASTKQEVSETYATIESVTSLETNTTNTIAGLKQEAADTYATIESVSSLETNMANSIAELKQEVSKEYATIESVTQLETDAMNAISKVEQTASETYATIESVNSLDTNMSNAIASTKQEVSETYATIESVTSLETNTTNALADIKQEAAETYATIESVTTLETETSKAIAGVKQETAEKYATIESVTSLNTDTSNAIAGLRQDVSDTYATIESVTSLESDISDSIAGLKQEVSEEYATIKSVTQLKTDTEEAISKVEQTASETYATIDSVAQVKTDATNAVSDLRQEVSTTYATNESLTSLRTDTTNAISATKEEASKTYATKSELTSFEGDTNTSMARIEQKADANGASINSLVSNIDKYSVGEYSQAYGLTREQSASILNEGMIYIPTVNHEEKYDDLTQSFTRGYYYTWNGSLWVESGSPLVAFVGNYVPAGSDALQYWYIESNEPLEGYEQNALYIWKDEQWVKVNILDGNVNNRITNMIRQETNELALEITNARGSITSLSERLDTDEATIQGIVTWKTDPDGNAYNLATIKQAADDAEASIAQVVENVGEDGEVNAASIVAAVNNAGSSVVIEADHLQLDGVVSFVDEKIGAVQGASVYDVKVEYALSSSDTEAPTSGWNTTAPEWQEGQYMWQKTTITKGDATVSSTTTCIQGAKGKDGEDGYTPVKGVDYFDGNDGDDGTSIIWKGTYASVPSNAENGWAYYNSTAKASYVYQNDTWYQMSIDGVDGQNGEDGSSIVWKGELSTAPTNPETNWVYKDSDDGKVYIYNGTGWELMVLDGNDGQDGTNGSDGLSVFITYNNSTTTPSAPTGNGTSNGWHTDATSASIWMSQKVAKDAASGTWGAPIKIKGEDGDDGVGIQSTTITYGASASSAVQPTSWQTSIPDVAAGGYLWTRTVIDYTDSSRADTVTYTYAKQGEKGETGTAGTSVTVDKIQYQAGTSATVVPTGTWSDTVVVAQEGQYLWTKTTFSNGKVAYGVAKQGVSGKDGAGIKKVNTHVRSFPLAWWQEHADPECTDTNWTTGASYDNSHIKQGDTVYIIGVATDVIGAGGAGVTVVLYGAAKSITSANVSIIPSHLITSGENGQQGLPGQTGVSVTSITAQYCLSATDSVAPTTGWTADLSSITWTPSNYIWCREEIAYSDGKTSHTTPRVDESLSLVGQWCSAADKTYIDGGKIYTGTITADKLSVNNLSAISANLGTVTAGTIQSSNYVADSAGMKINLNDGTWDSIHFKIASNGDVTMTGEVNATSGEIGGCKITNGKLKVPAANIGTLSAGDIDATTFTADYMKNTGLFVGEYIDAQLIYVDELYGRAAKIGGFTIESNGLSAENGSGSVHISPSGISIGSNSESGGSFGVTSAGYMSTNSCAIGDIELMYDITARSTNPFVGGYTSLRGLLAYLYNAIQNLSGGGCDHSNYTTYTNTCSECGKNDTWASCKDCGYEWLIREHTCEGSSDSIWTCPNDCGYTLDAPNDTMECDHGTGEFTGDVSDAYTCRECGIRICAVCGAQEDI